MITKTIGGDRVGSGRKMKAHLNHYYRSTHNLSEKFASSMGSGILYPALCKLAMRGDSFDIEINADARTIPTQGPLFGSYKMQVDVYQCPVRLYQALLHNNPTAIGLNMSKIMFPTFTVRNVSNNPEHYKFNNSSLLKYLGLSGMGTPEYKSGVIIDGVERRRTFNAIPVLAYYDIFKNYYANKQEEKGYVITVDDSTPKNPILSVVVHYYDKELVEFKSYKENVFSAQNIKIIDIQFDNTNDYTEQDIIDAIGIFESSLHFEQLITLASETTIGKTIPNEENKQYTISYYFDETASEAVNEEFGNASVYLNSPLLSGENYSPIKIKDFALKNIDDMRYDILSHHTMGRAFKIAADNTGNKLPYRSIIDGVTWRNQQQQTTNFDVNKNFFAENGLVLKTYQNDIFNNWLNTEWIEGENGISELSKVTVTDGAFSMDALAFANKLYNMLNRVVLSGNTYEDWQDVVYEEVKRKQVESPIFCGGMSQEIYFDEIVQTAPADGDPLGTLGGRGRLSGNKKGGKLHIKCDEACFIIAIVSLTPRIFYTQGNEFYMTDVFSMDDLHKPAMDGIGFQDLIGERAAFFDTVLGNIDDEEDEVIHRSKIGKIPAWMEYMTSVDKAYGDFADTDGKGYMILNRNYERLENENGIKDMTTYVDPSKYNYAFAYTELEAQNFWVEINFNIKARRLMSARLVPHV